MLFYVMILLFLLRSTRTSKIQFSGFNCIRKEVLMALVDIINIQQQDIVSRDSLSIKA